MNISDTQTDVSDFCELGDCQSINRTTCEKLPLVQNMSGNESEELYDEDGCFFTHQLRGTADYQVYLQVCQKIFSILCF